MTKLGYFDRCSDTVDAGEGGAGDLNLWTTDNSAFASASDRARAMQILTASAQYYRP